MKISAKLLFFMLRDINLCSILDIAGDSLPTLVEYFSMAASTLVPRVEAMYQSRDTSQKISMDFKSDIMKGLLFN